MPWTGQLGTMWNTPDIWTHRSFNPGKLTVAQITRIGLRNYHDEDVEVYINGTVVHSERGYTNIYQRRPLNVVARRVIVPDAENIRAVHCRQTEGGQYIDVGLEQVLPGR